MRCGYFDCASGVAGDMMLGALLDAGCPLPALQDVVARLGLPGVSLSAERVRRGGLAGTLARVVVESGSQKSHRHLSGILRIIEAASLEPAVAHRAAAVFRSLARAEGQAHGIAEEEVHFHEVGAADAIVDIVCACVGVAALGLERISSSPVPVGSGTVTCAHGVLPVPAPATAELLRGVPLCASDEPGELTTPTGAALLTTLAAAFEPLPDMTITAIGYGAGTREGRTRPNLLRLIVGEVVAAEAAEQDTVAVLEAQLDDATGQNLAYACERLLEAGALDAYIVPIIMKKGRPGQLLTVLCRPADAAAIEARMLAETSTFGVRRHDARRSKLAREHVTVATRFGPIRVKLGRCSGQIRQAGPEYEDCAAAARQADVPLHEVQQAALRAWAAREAPSDPAATIGHDDHPERD